MKILVENIVALLASSYHLDIVEWSLILLWYLTQLFVLLAWSIIICTPLAMFRSLWFGVFFSSNSVYLLTFMIFLHTIFWKEIWLIYDIRPEPLLFMITWFWGMVKVNFDPIFIWFSSLVCEILCLLNTVWRVHINKVLHHWYFDSPLAITN